MALIRAPFTDAEVRGLNAFQAMDFVHPFTCPRDHGLSVALVATPAGWICPAAGCDFRQDWAHDFQADGSAIRAQEDLTERLLAAR